MLYSSGRLVLTTAAILILTSASAAAFAPLNRLELKTELNAWCKNQSAHVTISAWDTSEVTDMSSLFIGLLCNPPIGKWNTSKVTDMSAMFEHTEGGFNQPIGKWATGQVISMKRMFFNAYGFNQPIGEWDTSQVTDMTEMFEHTKGGFNQPIGKWATGQVISLKRMFFNAYGFNQPIGKWNTSKVTDMKQMFENTKGGFNQPIGKWATGQVISMKRMFFNAYGFNQPIGEWDTSQVTDMTEMFQHTKIVNQPIGKWATGQVISMKSMFSNAQAFNQPIGEWDTSKVTDMAGMFAAPARSMKFNRPIGKWETSQVISMTIMFRNTVRFDQPIGEWDTSQVTVMERMFTGAAAFNQPIGEWDTRKVTDMLAMFNGAAAFNQPIGWWNTSQVTVMERMFTGAAAFNQPIGEWDTSQVTTMWVMFTRAAAFNQPIGEWNTSQVTNMRQMFEGANAFNQPIGEWDTSKATHMTGMFWSASSFNQSIGKWDTRSPGKLEVKLQISGARQTEPIVLDCWTGEGAKNGVWETCGASIRLFDKDKEGPWHIDGNGCLLQRRPSCSADTQSRLLIIKEGGAGFSFTLVNITLKNGKWIGDPGAPDAGGGAAIFVDNANAPVHFKSTTFESNKVLRPYVFQKYPTHHQCQHITWPGSVSSDATKEKMWPRGGALRSKSPVNLTRCLFASNRLKEPREIKPNGCKYTGGAVFVDGADSLRADDCTFRDNNRDVGLRETNTGGAHGSYYVKNTLRGGALYVKGHSNGASTALMLTRCLFESNDGTRGAALYVAGDVRLGKSSAIRSCTFQSNGGISKIFQSSTEAGITTSEECPSIRSNGHKEAAWRCARACQVFFKDVATHGDREVGTNTYGPGSAEAVYVDMASGALTFVECTFASNRGLPDNSGIVARATENRGGGAVVFKANVAVAFDACNFHNNAHVQYGGAVSVEFPGLNAHESLNKIFTRRRSSGSPCLPPDRDHNCAKKRPLPVVISRSSFTGNEAGMNNGARKCDDDRICSKQMLGTGAEHISGFRGAGGAVFAAAVNIWSSSFSDHGGSNGNGVAKGGAILLWNRWAATSAATPVSHITDSVFERNAGSTSMKTTTTDSFPSFGGQVAGSGGAIEFGAAKALVWRANPKWIQKYSIVPNTAFIERCTFRSNAAYRGGALNVDHGLATLTACAFAANSATYEGGAVFLAYTVFSMNGAPGWGNASKASPLYSTSRASFVACQFLGNAAGTRGGGVSTAVPMGKDTRGRGSAQWGRGPGGDVVAGSASTKELCQAQAVHDGNPFHDDNSATGIYWKKGCISSGNGGYYWNSDPVGGNEGTQVAMDVVVNTERSLRFKHCVFRGNTALVGPSVVWLEPPPEQSLVMAAVLRTHVNSTSPSPAPTPRPVEVLPATSRGPGCTLEVQMPDLYAVKAIKIGGGTRRVYTGIETHCDAVQDPSNTDCSDPGWGLDVCSNPNYPQCVGFVANATWGKCFSTCRGMATRRVWASSMGRCSNAVCPGRTVPIWSTLGSNNVEDAASLQGMLEDPQKLWGKLNTGRSGMCLRVAHLTVHGDDFFSTCAANNASQDWRNRTHIFHRAWSWHGSSSEGRPGAISLFNAHSSFRECMHGIPTANASQMGSSFGYPRRSCDPWSREQQYDFDSRSSHQGPPGAISPALLRPFLHVECQPCPDGQVWHFDSELGSAVCRRCDATEVLRVAGNDTAATCQPCPTGAWCANGISHACAAGTFNDAVRQTACRLCAAGTFSDETGQSSPCGICDVGKVTTTAGKTACADCPAGRASNSAADGCVSCGDVCPANTYVPPGLAFCSCAACTSCGPGRFMTDQCGVDYKDRQCGDCPAGTYSSTSNSPSCTRCTTGKFQDEGSRFACDACPEGFVSEYENSTACMACLAGHYASVQGTSSCAACAAGQFQAEEGQFACADCPDGYVGAPNATTCDVCVSGRFANNKRTACVTCLSGMYQVEQGKTLCGDCPAGFMSNRHAEEVPGATLSSCSACATGKFAGTPGAAACEACSVEARRYAPVSTGASICKQCAAFAVTVTRHATPGRPGPLFMRTCECRPGYYEPDFSLDPGRGPAATVVTSPCMPCPIGATCNTAIGGVDTIDFEGRLATRPGYWRQRDWRTLGMGGGQRLVRVDEHSESELFLPCDQPKACIGTAHLLADVRRYVLFNSTASNESQFIFGNLTLRQSNRSHPFGTPVLESVSQCRVGHDQHSPLCGTCESGWKMDGEKLCRDCRDSTEAYGAMIKGLVFSVASVLICLLVTYVLVLPTEPSNTAATQASVDKSSDMQDDVAEASDAGANLLVLFHRFSTMLPYLQRIGSLDAVFVDLTWPPIALSLLNIFKLFIMQFGNILAFISPCTLAVKIEDEMLIALLLVPWAILVGAIAKLTSGVIIRKRHQSVLKEKRAQHAELTQSQRNLLGPASSASASASASRTKGKTTKKSRKERVAAKVRERRRVKKKQDKLRQRERNYIDLEACKHAASVRLLALFLLFSKFGHPGISQQLLEIGVCFQVSGRYVVRTAKDVECRMGNSRYDKLYMMSVIGTVLVTIMLPIAMALVIRRDRLMEDKERKAHEAERKEEMDAELREVMHARTVLDRVVRRAHTWRQRRVLAFETAKHRSVQWFTARWKPHLWWWFLVEMLFSVVLISFMQLASYNMGLQYYGMIVVAGGQFLLPALIRPHKAVADDHVAILGSLAYFLLVVSRLPRIFLDLAIANPDFDPVAHERGVSVTNALTEINFVLCVSGLFLLLLSSILKASAAAAVRACRNARDKYMRRRQVKVTPSRASKKSRSPSLFVTNSAAVGADAHPTATRGREGKADSKGGASNARTEGEGKADRFLGKLESMPKHLTRCRDHILLAAGQGLRSDYVNSWCRLVDLQAEIMATSIQAAVRGNLGRANFGHILAEVSRMNAPAEADENGPSNHTKVVRVVEVTNRVAAASATAGSLVSVSRRRAVSRQNSHRLVNHSKQETVRLLAKIKAFENELLSVDGEAKKTTGRSRRKRLVRNSTLGASSRKLTIVATGTARMGGGNGDSDSDEGGAAVASKAESELLHIAKGWSAAELSGLHELNRISDNQMVALMALQHEAEQATRRELLNNEKKEARVAGHRKRLKRKLSHYLRSSGLTRAEARQHFDACDVNKDGFVSAHELVELEVLRPCFEAQHDGDSSHDDGRAEGVEALQSLIAAADKDGDSLSLSFEEFCSMLFLSNDDEKK